MVFVFHEDVNISVIYGQNEERKMTHVAQTKPDVQKTCFTFLPWSSTFE